MNIAMHTLGKQRFRLFQFSAAIRSETSSPSVNEIGEHPQARSRPFGETFFDASVWLCSNASLEHPAGGCVNPS